MPLCLIPTPVGNLKDITLRALETLKECDLILAEDTRTTGRLLKAYDIETPLKSYHIHNEHKVVPKVVEELKNGNLIGLVSDAGTPAISDPGFLLVREAIKEGIEIDCLPGATAFVPALVISGFPTDSFVFEGFLPPKKGRITKIKQLAEEQRTIILYESPHKLEKLLYSIFEYFGPNRKLSIIRELTKMYQEVIRGTISEILSNFDQLTVKGEFVIIIEAKSNK